MTFFALHTLELRERLDRLEQEMLRRRLVREAEAGRARLWALVSAQVDLEMAALSLEALE